MRVLGVGHCVQPHPSHAHDTPQRFGRIYHTPPTPPNAHAHTSPPHTQQPPNPPRWPLSCPRWWRASSAWPAPTPWCSASSRRRESTSSPVGLASQLPVWLPRNRGAIWAGRACDAWCPIAWHLGCPGGRRRSGCVWGCVRALWVVRVASPRVARRILVECALGRTCWGVPTRMEWCHIVWECLCTTSIESARPSKPPSPHPRQWSPPPQPPRPAALAFHPPPLTPCPPTPHPPTPRRRRAPPGDLPQGPAGRLHGRRRDPRV